MENSYPQAAPVYLQIVADIRRKIASGAWPPGMPVQPVRELSVQLGVNPNTARRALEELAREGLVHTDEAGGCTLTRNVQRIHCLREGMAQACADAYRAQMAALGFSTPEMLRVLADSNTEGGQVPADEQEPRQ